MAMTPYSGAAMNMSLGTKYQSDAEAEQEAERKKRAQAQQQQRAMAPFSGSYMSLTGNQY